MKSVFMMYYEFNIIYFYIKLKEKKNTNFTVNWFCVLIYSMYNSYLSCHSSCYVCLYILSLLKHLFHFNFFMIFLIFLLFYFWIFTKVFFFDKFVLKNFQYQSFYHKNVFCCIWWVYNCIKKLINPYYFWFVWKFDFRKKLLITFYCWFLWVFFIPFYSKQEKQNFSLDYPFHKDPKTFAKFLIQLN